jgi:hypothetical protein
MRWMVRYGRFGEAGDAGKLFLLEGERKAGYIRNTRKKRSSGVRSLGIVAWKKLRDEMR